MKFCHINKKYSALASHLIEKYQSYDMDISIIKILEERVNGEAKYMEKNEKTLDQ